MEEFIMSMITLSAHFDGEKICLDEPFNLSPNSKLAVTILSESENDNEHEDWLNLSEQKLIDVYGENEPEYSTNLLKEINPKYEGR